MLNENLKTPMWRFDDGRKHEVIYKTFYWGDEFELL